jgi:hemerythrin-like domain-containing protein
MLKDCHRRIEHFLEVLRKVERRFVRGELDDQGRRALEAALDYFASFAPRHTAEQRIFAVASRILESEQVREIGEEMRERCSLTSMGNATADRLEQDRW